MLNEDGYINTVLSKWDSNNAYHYFWMKQCFFLFLTCCIIDRWSNIVFQITIKSVASAFNACLSKKNFSIQTMFSLKTLLEKWLCLTL